MKLFHLPALFALLLCVTVRSSAAQDDEPTRALLVIGGCCHDYKAQQKLITEGVSARANVQWTISYDPDKGTQHKNPVYDNPDWAKGFDVVVHDECTAGVTDIPFIRDRVLKPHREGLPAVVLHCGMHSYRSDGFPDATPWFEFTGLRSTGHGPQLPIAVQYVDKEHPISTGLADWTTTNEELYNNLQLLDTAHALARGKQKVKRRNGEERTDDCVVAWTNTYNGKTRVFATTLGHNNETVADARHLDLVTRGLLWAVDKLDEKHLKPAKKVLSGDAGAAAVPVRENLAHGKKATASSAQDESRAAAAAFDGDETTRWCAAGDKAPQWLQVDLGAPQDVTGFHVAWELDDKPYGHRIETSADGKDWAVALDATAVDSGGKSEADKVVAKGVRHVRLAVTGLQPGAWASVYEFQVFGTRMVQPAVLSPAEQRQKTAARITASLKAPEGFELTAFAVPPDLNYPTVVAASPRGELFIGVDEMGSLGRKPGRGRVVRCADRDGDGIADEFKTFATMDHPRGLSWDDAASTLYVLHPPFLTAYTDDNADGIADRSKVLVKGITNEKIQAERGADHTTNNIRMAIDGWIYIAMGDFGCVKAEGADGRTLQMHGGGVVRVRPDGSRLEQYTFGQRNIYDVAIDPFLNAFTRDNTNDGDGWDVRLSQIVPTGNYGYPRLFKNFPDEIVRPMLELGGGSPCGALFVDEPGLPGDAGRMLYTVEWGRNAIMRHPLAAGGAGFTAKEEKWFDLPRGTDLDVDGHGSIYVSSWANGGFDYSGPDVGYVVRLTAKGQSAEAFPDLRSASEEDLVSRHLASPSGVLRLAAQREILKRGGSSNDFVQKLLDLAQSQAPLQARVAAVMTVSQLPQAEARGNLATLASRDDLREFVLRAFADSESLAAGEVELFVRASEDANPRVRLMAAWGIGRIGGGARADALVRLAGDDDPLVAHAAVNSLVRLRAYDACANALDPSTPRLVAGAARALQGMHETRVVELLSDKLATQQDAAVRSAVYRALCRLAFREADWDAGWWGTRPDTSGPYYKQADWEGTAKVRATLAAALKSERPELLRTLVLELKRNKIDLPEAAPVIAKLAETDAGFRNLMIDLLSSRQRPTPDEAALLRRVAVSGNEAPALRAKAIRLLARGADDPAALDVLVEVLAPIAGGEPVASELRAAYDEVTRDRRLARRTRYFEELAKSDSAPKRAFADAVLRNAKPEAAKPAGRAIGAMGLEDVLVAVAAAKGKAADGAALFTKVGCAACHTVAADEPPKGPFLGGISTRYNRSELIESVLKPSAKISQGFETQWFKLAKGDPVEGFVTHESGDEIELRNITGDTTVLKKDAIQRRGKRDISTMPEGVVANLTAQELADLLAYLESLQAK